jgi:tRNA (adenine-N(1)-)-methyltransferase non-catalytic subunit
VTNPTPTVVATMTSTSIADGAWVLLQFSDGEQRLVRVQKGKKMGAGKQSVLMDPLIGLRYGSCFRVEPSGLVHDARTMEEISGSVVSAPESISDVVDAKAGASNAELFDEGAASKAQKLGDADIRRLKESGLHGAELVKAIAANSATFSGKTAFAQDKYLRKKAKKHMVVLTCMCPSPLTLCDFYMKKGPERLLNLRRDSLALVLTLSNAQPHSRCLIVENTLGLLAAGIVQRLGGHGHVLAATLAKPALDCVQYLNMPNEWTAVLRSCPLADLLALPPPEFATPPSSDAPAAAIEEAATAADAAMAEAAAEPEGGNGGGTSAAGTPGNNNGKATTSIRGEELAVEASKGYTSLVIAIREAPSPAILGLLGRLIPGSPFVVDSQSIQPLAECLHACQQAKAAVRLQLQETWTRKYQVAPNRTHPEMNSYPPTGYVLSGLAVQGVVR